MSRGQHRIAPGRRRSGRYDVFKHMPDSWVPASGVRRRGKHRASPAPRVQRSLAVATASLSLLSIISVLTFDQPPPIAPGATLAAPVILDPSAPPPTVAGEATTTAAGAVFEQFALVGEVWDEIGGAGAHVEGQAQRLAFIVNEDGVIVAEEPSPDTGIQTRPATTETTAPVTETTGADFGRPTLWLSSFVAPAAASASVPSDGRVVVLAPQPDDARGCYLEARSLTLRDERERYDRNALAQMTHLLWECLGRVNGLSDEVPTKLRSWDAGAVWGFADLAEQVAAEAVVVAYCESVGFAHHALVSNNPWGYGGLFQMGGNEMRRFGGSGLSKFDPVDNAYASANYFLFQRRTGAGWGGWSPWAVVNTNFNDEVNDQVRVPVLPRFRSTDPSVQGRRGPELPQWAVDPWSFEVPDWAGCPYNGGRWAEALPLG